MRYHDLYIAGSGRHLPPAITVAEAAERGLCDPVALAKEEMISAACSQGESAPEMAAQAARQALERSGRSAADIDVLLYANVFYQGHDMWPPPSFIMREAIGNSSPAVEVKQMSNGGMAAMELAAAYILSSPERSSAMVVAADRFCLPGIDRWHSDAGTVFGDGGAALVLSRHGGFARLCSLATVSDPELEQMHRGDDPFGLAPYEMRRPLDVVVGQKAFVAKTRTSYIVARVKAGQDSALKQALAEADATLEDIDWFVLPHFGIRRLKSGFLTPLGIDVKQTTWEWSRSVGHLGAADQYAGLDHLAASGRLSPGDRCLLMGVGAGFTWSSAVVDIVDHPAWADSQE
jgi:3-oxoacyl-[acyl-carrier-protein] synthase III